MRQLFTIAAVLAAISCTPATTNANIFGLFGFDCCGGHNCGCANRCCGGGCGCGCEQSCCCDQGCGCEVSCGCEPACGCGSGCFANGRQYAGRKFQSCCQTYVPICPCTGPCGGCCQSGCGECCEPACGCDCGNCCEPACGTGCGECCAPCAPCRPRKCCLKNCGFCGGLGSVLSVVCSCTPCSGCNGETYWSEWHNDPPRCQDPCNCQGQWIGPSSGPGACGSCNGGCSGGSCPCNSGGYTAAPVRSNGMNNHAMVAQAKRPMQQQGVPVRTASRPVSRPQMQPMQQTRQPQSNGQQARPIQW